MTVFFYLRDEVLEDGHPLYPKLRRRITREEYRQAVEWANDKGLHRGVAFDSC